MGGNWTIANFEQFEKDMRAAGHSDDDIRRGWAALQFPPKGGGIEVVPGGTEVPLATSGMGVPYSNDAPTQGMGLVRYKQMLRQKEDQELNKFIDQEMKTPSTNLGEPLTPSVEPPKPKPGAIAAGAQTAGAMFLKGGQHFVDGMFDAAYAMEPFMGKKTQGYGSEAILGGLTMLMAIPSGVGVAVTKAIDGYIPNMDMTIALPGAQRIGDSSPAGYVRAFLGVPSLLLGAKMRQTLKDHPELVEQELNRPMTYKELFENIIAFGAAPFVNKVAVRGFRFAAERMTPEPIQIQNAVKGAAAPPQAPPGATYSPYVETPRTGAVTLSDSNWSSYVRDATSTRQTGNIDPSQIAQRVDTIAQQLSEISKDYTPEALAPKAPTGEAPVKPSAAEPPIAGVPSTPGAPSGETPPTALGPISQMSENMRVAIDAVKETLTKSQEPTTPKPRWTEMHDAMPGEPLAYLDTPGMAFEKSPAVIVKEGESFIIRNQKGEDIGHFGSMDEAMRAGEQILPQDVKGSMLQETKIPASQARYLQTIASDVEAAMKHYLGDQAGRVDPALLAHMAVGAIIGGTQGTTPEERLTYAFTGLVGGIFARRLASRLLDAVRKNPEAAPILDTSNPVNAGLKPPVPEYAQTTEVMGRIADRTNVSVKRILTNDPPLQRSDIRPVQQISAEASKNVVDLARRITDGEAVLPGELKQAFALARDLHTATRKIGREVGIRNLPEREAALATKSQIDRLAKEWDPSTSEARLAEMIMDLPDVGLGARLYYAVPDALLETMYTGQLLGTALVRNGVAMIGTMPMTIMGKSFASMRVWRPNAPPLDSAAQGAVAALEGLYEQIRLARSWDSLGVQAAALGPTKVEIAPRGFSALAEIASDYNLDGVSQGLNFMHSLAGVAPEILARTDGMGKAWFGRVFTHWEALDAAAREGKTYEGFWDKYENLKTNYDELSGEARIRVAEARDQYTANKKFEGAFMQMLQAGPQDPWLNLGYRLLVAPYVRTPIRLAEMHADFTPGLNLASTNYRAAMAAGGAQAEMARGQLYAGVAMFTGAVWLASQGYITGPAPGDPKDAKAMKDAGMPPMSFWDPLSQKYRSYAGLEPLSTVLASGAVMARIVSQIPEASFTKLMLAFGEAEAQAIPQKSYLQALSQMYDVIKNGSTDATWEKAVDYIRLRLASFNPVGAAEIEKLVDPAQRRVMKFDTDNTPEGLLRREAYMLWQQATMGIPGVSTAVDAKKQRNMWTGDVIWNNTWPFNPFTQNAYNGDNWAREVQRLNGAGIDPIDQFIGGRQPAVNVGMTPVTPSPAVRLSDSQLDRMEVLMTQVVKDSHGNLVKSLGNLVETPLYRRSPDVTKQEMLQARWAEFRDRAEAALMREDRNLRLKVEQASRTNERLRAPGRGNITITPR